MTILTCPLIHLFGLAGSERYLTVVAKQADAGNLIFLLCHYSLNIITLSPRPRKPCTAPTGFRPFSQRAVFLLPYLQFSMCLPPACPLRVSLLQLPRPLARPLLIPWCFLPHVPPVTLSVVHRACNILEYMQYHSPRGANHS